MKRNTKAIAFIFNILILATIGHCRVFQPNDANLIEQTCRRTPNHDLCVRILRGDPRSNSADIRGLALILVDVIRAKANATLNKINQLLSGNPGLKEALLSCASKYKTIVVADVAQAREALKKGDPKFAEDGANDVVVEATGCENGFPARRSPLTSDNNNIRAIAGVTAAVVRNLL